MGAIFIFLTLVLIGGVLTVAWFLDAFAQLWDNVVTTFQGVELIWIIGFIGLAGLLAKLWNRLTNGGLGGPGYTATAFINICLFTFAIWFGIIPMINSTRWNGDFKCTYDGHCDINDQCVSVWLRPLTECDTTADTNNCTVPDDFRTGFCARPFRDVEKDTEELLIGKAEFTQRDYKSWLGRQAWEDCDRLKAVRKRDDCRDRIPDLIAERFARALSPENCTYPLEASTTEEAVFVNDDAPMVCVSRAEATAICAAMGGRLPTVDDYDWMQDDRKFSCKNTVMSGLDEFAGANRVLKARQIDAMTSGAGCGTGKFHKACEKAQGGNTGDGLCDVWGNVSEWSADGPALGGSFMSTAGSIRTPDERTEAASWIGFRCVLRAKIVNQ